METKKETLKPEKVSQAADVLGRIQKSRTTPLGFIKNLGPSKLKSVKKPPFIILAAFFVLIILVLFLKTSSLGSRNLPRPTPTGIDQLIETPGVASPSAYASDSAVLSIEKELKNIEELLKETKFRETSLLLPEIDMGVKFNLKK